MINLMTAGAGFNYEAEELCTTAKEAGGTTAKFADPSACTFWCAVALGAVMKGSPVESVSRTVIHRRRGSKVFAIAFAI